jgi:outer membrane protein TolC
LGLISGDVKAAPKLQQEVLSEMNSKRAVSPIAIFLFTLLLADPQTASCQQTDPDGSLTLAQAVGLALQNNRQLRIKELSVNKAEDQLSAARTTRLPKFNLYTLGSQQLSKIDFTFEQGVFGTFPGIGPVPDKDTRISTAQKPTFLIVGQITEPISQHYQIGLNLKLLDTSREIAKEQLRAEQQTVVNDVKRAFYAILQTQSTLQTAEENIKLYRELDRVTGDYVAQRVALKSQNLDVKTRLAKAEYDALTLLDQLAIQKQQLNNLLGRDINMEFSVSAVLEPTGFETDLVAAKSQALTRRPEITEARLKLKQAELDRRIKKSEYIPEISASFNYISPQNFGSLIPKSIMSVGLVFSWEVWDWGKRRRELDEKSRTVEQAKTSVVEAENAVLMDLNSKHRKLQQTRLQLRIAQLAQETARENLRVSTNKYQVQAALLSDVLQTQTALADANTQYQQAVLSYWTAKADFAKATGEDK